MAYSNGRDARAHRPRTRLLLLAAFALLALPAPAEAARSADVETRKALSVAAAKFSRYDSLALDSRGRFVEQREGFREPFVLRGFWVSELSPRWARVIVRTERDDRISTVLKKINGRWRALASGGLSERRDGLQCRRSKIPALVAIDLGLGHDRYSDPSGRCEGSVSARRRALTAGELGALSPTATSWEWTGSRDDFGSCVDYVPDQGPRRGWASRSMPAWSYMLVYCDAGWVGGAPAQGIFAAVMRSGQPFERLNLSTSLPGRRCWNGEGLRGMPIRARLELGLCTPTPRALYDAAR